MGKGGKSAPLNPMFSKSRLCPRLFPLIYPNQQLMYLCARLRAHAKTNVLEATDVLDIHLYGLASRRLGYVARVLMHHL